MNLQHIRFTALCLILLVARLGLAQPPANSVQDTAARALAIIAAKWNWKAQMPQWVIMFSGPRAAYQAKTNFQSWYIETWMRQSWTEYYAAGVLAHELAHAWDDEYMTEAMRQEWMAIRGLPPNTTWEPPCPCVAGQECLCSDLSCGNGDFAESVAWTLIGPGMGFNSKLKSTPNRAQQALIKRWLGIT